MKLTATDEQVKQAVLLGLRLKLDVEKISEDLSVLYDRPVTPEYIEQVAMERGMLLKLARKNSEGFHPDWYAQLTEMVKAGKSAALIAKELGRLPQTVRQAIKRLGLKAARHESRLDIVRKRYLAGEYQADIARDLGLTNQTVSAAVRNLPKHELKPMSKRRPIHSEKKRPRGYHTEQGWVN
jgi:DNA-binding NarL/FixJ family response regulator